ncbi:hypothetical protein M1M30_gp183 [Maribacter phage Colly_1]|uniref:Uncharacterized protein n=1 Tax=Maribacter phage Colly_1 TaxID=2745691 RepID=A0A8E4UXY3_9CAUD|nr:hypothetical protein M1M30_gp183 [Maribacter phage Colly_1]QQO97288.1 hypothetical protein Colly1_183 [Maribacter phage Colly_1]
MKTITTVGGLKKALENLPDDRGILSQVIGSQEGAWTMKAEFHSLTGPLDHPSDYSVITLSHPDLKTLPWTNISNKEVENAINVLIPYLEKTLDTSFSLVDLDKNPNLLQLLISLIQAKPHL